MKKKIVFGLIIFVLMFCLGSIYILTIIERNTYELRRIAESHNIAVFRGDLLINIIKIQDGIKLKGTPYLKEVDFHLGNVSMIKAVKKCMMCHHSPAIGKTIKDLENQIERYEEKITLIFTTFPKSAVSEGQKAVALKLGDELIKKIEHMIAESSVHLKESEKITLHMVNYRKNILLFIVIVGPFFALGFAFILIKGITKPVNSLLDATRRLKAGDLDYRIEGMKDEFGELAESFNEMAGSLKGQMQEIQRTGQLLKKARDSLESFVEGITDPTVATDKKGIITYINKGLTEILGYEREHTIGKHVSIMYPDGMEESRRVMGLLKENGKFHGYETQLIKKDGSILFVILSLSLLRDKSGEVMGTLGISKDITERKRLENELRKTRDFLENIVEGSIDVIMTTNRKGIVTFVNRAAKDIMGYKPEEMTGIHVSKYYIGGINEIRKISRILGEKGILENYDTTLIGKKGRLIPSTLSGSLLKDEKGREIGTLGVFKDITEKERFEKELERLSITDNLTGLYNQRHFYNELKREIERAKRFNHPLSLILFDIDEFKHYNDTYGHLGGDKVLYGVGEAVSKCIRGNVDSGYRYGGDEFVVILPETDKNRALSLAERIRISVNNAELGDVTLSMGLIEYRIEYDLETFVRHADKAMYTAKQSGGNRVSVYE